MISVDGCTLGLGSALAPGARQSTLLAKAIYFEQ
jgi:hypothetical protein